MVECQTKNCFQIFRSSNFFFLIRTLKLYLNIPKDVKAKKNQEPEILTAEDFANDRMRILSMSWGLPFTIYSLIRKSFSKTSIKDNSSVLVCNVEALIYLNKNRLYESKNLEVVFISLDTKQADYVRKQFPFAQVRYIEKEKLIALLSGSMEWPCKFDLIIGNPPYQYPKGNNHVSKGKSLFLDFIEVSKNLLKEDGELVLIGPPNYLKPTDYKNKTRSYNLEGLTILSIETGIENEWEEKERPKTFISLLHCKKGDYSNKFHFNGKIWDIDKIPFILFHETFPKETFEIIWEKITNKKLGKNLEFKRMKPAQLRQQENTDFVSFTPRAPKGRMPEKPIVWGNDIEVIGNLTQIVNLDLGKEKMNILFSSKLFRLFNYFTYADPTVYHNLLNCIVLPKSLKLNKNTSDIEIMKSYGFNEDEIKVIKELKFKND